MGYSYIYLFCLLILFMFIMRFFLPLIIYLIPVFFIVFILKTIFGSKKKTQTHESYDHNQDTYYQQNQQSSNPDVIDVDYKVVDEENTDTH